VNHNGNNPSLLAITGDCFGTIHFPCACCYVYFVARQKGTILQQCRPRRSNKRQSHVSVNGQYRICSRGEFLMTVALINSGLPYPSGVAGRIIPPLRPGPPPAAPPASRASAIRVTQGPVTFSMSEKGRPSWMGAEVLRHGALDLRHSETSLGSVASAW
jgi:hypothetical protein